ncbi:VOC family protein [Achromobacter xylosoxidans]
MKFGYTIIYVPDVPASLRFFEDAFGFARRFLHESNTYGELETGETTLAFAASELADLHFEGGVIPAGASARPLGVEIAFVTQDVAGAHVRAVNAGATQLSAPETKPWGQVVSYVRCPDGSLVELCSPIQA